tara:strand:+ start:1865 stop:2014 length:150 start_codon:yes stop_codon:yes gene_type:complete
VRIFKRRLKEKEELRISRFGYLGIISLAVSLFLYIIVEEDYFARGSFGV